ncbi:pectinesterase family protein [Haloferax denitrificans]|uniref:Pectin methylesterase n=1 Tax=Haloferax denitrificans ATCC 35960 TaxID=662478 RepID=M0JLD8_9EURY|nr:pectinesterase family protein [Haloferax denitrificans]EMA08485.1 pectin methylesterase [Haloferax denitrificans ATCC 35960]
MLALLTALAVAVGCLGVAAGAVGTLGDADDGDDASEPDDSEDARDSDDSDKYDYVVAKDGTGDYETIQAAIDGAKSFPPDRIRILVRAGVYDEKVEVHAWNPDVTLVGERAGETVITHDDHFEKIDRGRNSTFFTHTLKVRGNDFRARNLTVENSAGPVGQAVALHVDADRASFENCRFLGHQDTVYAAGEGARQYFSECYVEGTTDFVFGGATAVFENCRVHSKADSYVTAASTPEDEPFGFVFLDCELTADADVSEVYLGRPWRNHARTAFLRTRMDSHVLPAGWHNWSRPEAESTVEYVEYDSRGPGAEGERVSWATTLTEDEVGWYSKGNVLSSEGDGEWWDWEE